MAELSKLNAAFDNFESEETSSEVLKAGQHACRLISWAGIHSMMDNKGNIKNKVTEYEDVTPQVYCVFGSTENKGAIAHRFQLEGYLHYDELSDKERESGKYTCSTEGYALIEKKGKFFRVQDEDNTASARRILSQAMAGMGIPAGSGLNALDDVCEDKLEFNVIVKEKSYDGKTYQEVSAIRKLAPVIANIADEAL
jgi:hypothetical protein